MVNKTNAVRLVEKAGYSCEEAFYEFNEKDLNGMHAAEAIGLPPEQVFKTLVARGMHTGIHIFCIPVCCELDLKSAAKAAGDKKMELVSVKELLNLTGYIRGGCSPIGMKKKYPTHIDETCQLYEKIAVSAGERGHQMIFCKRNFFSQIFDGDAAVFTVAAEHTGEFLGAVLGTIETHQHITVHELQEVSGTG